MKTILVDAVDAFVSDKGEIFQAMYKMLENYPNRKIILTGANDEQFKEFGLDKMPYGVFTLKHNPEKTDPAYYQKMLEHFGLNKDEIVYFEHNPDAVKSAQSAGIKTYFYDNDRKDLKSLKDFLDKNLWRQRTMKARFTSLLKITGIPVAIASLCCLAPVIIVFFGLGSVSLAASLSDKLFGEYRWVFRAVGLALLAMALIWYLRREKGICTLDEAKKRRNEIINVVVLTLITAITGYILFLYVVLEYAGRWLGIWR